MSVQDRLADVHHQGGRRRRYDLVRVLQRDVAEAGARMRGDLDALGEDLVRMGRQDCADQREGEKLGLVQRLGVRANGEVHPDDAAPRHGPEGQFLVGAEVGHGSRRLRQRQRRRRLGARQAAEHAEIESRSPR